MRAKVGYMITHLTGQVEDRGTSGVGPQVIIYLRQGWRQVADSTNTLPRSAPGLTPFQ